MSNFTFLPFYKLYDWILYEFGASTDAALLSIIQSFEDNRLECRLSYTQFADILKVCRPNAIARIKKLIDSGYITVKNDSTHGNSYKINRNAFDSASNEIITSDISASNENDTSTSNEIITSTSNENDTSTSNENDTTYIIENKTDTSYRELERERDTLADDSDEIFVGSMKNVRLTQKQYEHLKYGFLYGEGDSCESLINYVSSKLAEGMKIKNPYAYIVSIASKKSGFKELSESDEWQMRENEKQYEYASQYSDYGSEFDI